LESSIIKRRIVDQRNINFLVFSNHVVSSEIKDKFFCGRSNYESCISRFRTNIGKGCGVYYPRVSSTFKGTTVFRDSVRVNKAGGNSQASKDKDSNLHGIKLEYFDYFFLFF